MANLRILIFSMGTISDDGDTRALVGNKMAERLLPKLSAWDRKRLAIADELAKAEARGRATGPWHSLMS